MAKSVVFQVSIEAIENNTLAISPNHTVKGVITLTPDLIPTSVRVRALGDGMEWDVDHRKLLGLVGVVIQNLADNGLRNDKDLVLEFEH